MDRKGLCNSCVAESICVLPRKFPVWHCEEFSTNSSRPLEINRIKSKSKPDKAHPLFRDFVKVSLGK